MKKIFLISLFVIGFASIQKLQSKINSEIEIYNQNDSRLIIESPPQTSIFSVFFDKGSYNDSLFDLDEDDQDDYSKIEIGSDQSFFSVNFLPSSTINLDAFPDLHLQKSQNKIFILNSVFRL